MDWSSSQLFSSRGACASSKVADHLGALGAMAHHFGTGAAAGEQLQRIHQDGFAGAGFAGEHGQSRAQLQLERIDDGEVADMQVE